MSEQVFDPALFAQILSEAANQYRAKVYDSLRQQPAGFVKVGPIPLDVAPLNPIALPSPMSAIQVQDATDSTVKVKLILHTDTKYAVDHAYTMSLNDSPTFDDPIGKAFLTWDAQPGKTATLFVAVGARFQSGKIISTTSGGVTISEGSGVTSIAGAQVSAVASQLFAADTTRFMMSIQNQGTVSIYLGDSAVTKKGGAKPGIELVPGGTYEWKSTAACWAVTDTATTGATDISLTKWT